MFTLFIVATPIGNLEDISFRAVRKLKEVSLIASEDTRTTMRLMKHYGINTTMISYYEHNKQSKLRYILNKLEEGDVALVSEAGMPAISDPGYELVVAALQQKINIVVIPGASAFVSALAISGLPTDACHYLGFLPRKASERKKRLASVAQEKVTLAFYEAPHRIQESLHDILSVLGNRRIAVCRELTKIHEEVFRGTVMEACVYFEQPKGEFSIIVEGNIEEKAQINSNEVHYQLMKLKKSGLSAKEALSMVAMNSEVSHRELYREWLQLK